MRKFLIIIILVQAYWCNAQNISFGTNTSLYMGDSVDFFFGGNTTFNGDLENDGTIVSYSDLDFVNNTEVGNLKFVGVNDQNLYGDTINATSIEVDKQNDLVLLTDQVTVSGALEVTSGVIQAEEEDDLLVTGGAGDDGEGYVEGKLVGLTSGVPVTFPMGVSGFPNYITFSNTLEGIVLRVECLVPDPATLIPTEDMVGIADEVEWVVTSINDDVTEAEITIDFDGLDFVNFSNGEFINADVYEPAIVVFSEGDSTYRMLSSVEASPSAGRTSTSGRVESNEIVTLSSSALRVSIAWIPLIDGPEFFVPTAFSPSGFYEENQVFRPFFAGSDVIDVSINVYNAYNQTVYSYNESGDILDISSIGWDGRLSSGVDAAEGVYYYRISLVTTDETYQRTGSVLLVR